MNKMQMIIRMAQKAVTLFVVVVVCLGYALVTTSLQNLTAGPVFGTPTASISSQEDWEKLYLTPLPNPDKWKNNDAFLHSTLTPLDGTSTITSYARKYEDQIIIVILNNSAANQSIVINLGSRWISCSSVKNIWVENDPNIRLNHPGSGIDSLSVKLNAWEPKIIQCEQRAPLAKSRSFDTKSLFR